MNLLAYIQGKRKGKEAHRLEREAMQDPFLADALDGFDAVDDNHAERIAAIRARLAVQEERKPNRKIAYISIAASLLACISIGSYFLINNNDNHSLIAQNELPASEEKISSNVPVEEEAGMDMQAISEMPEDLKESIRNNTESAKKKAVTVSPPPPPPSKPILQLEPECSMADEYIEMESAMMMDAEAMDVQPHSAEDTLMIATKQAKQSSAKTATTPANANQRALTDSGAFRKPEPEIGMSAYKKYLKEAMIRPKTGDCAKKKGIVIVEFRINAEGKPHNFVYRKKLCEESDKEAVRLIESGPAWVGDTDKTVMLEVKF